MWRAYWQNVDPGIAEAIVAQLLRWTRNSELYWNPYGTKFRTAVFGSWTFALNTLEFSELPTLVAYRGGSAVVLVCDQQASRCPFSVQMMELLSLLERQLPKRAAMLLCGEDGKNVEERLEEEVGGYLERTQREVTIKALSGAILRELRGWR